MTDLALKEHHSAIARCHRIDALVAELIDQLVDERRHFRCLVPMSGQGAGESAWVRARCVGERACSL